MEDIASVAGRTLRTFRKRRGLTLAQLAQRSGLSEGHLSSMETGATSPTLSTLALLASVLGAELSDFFRTEERTRIHVHRADTATQVSLAGGREVYTLLSARTAGATYNALSEVLSCSPEGTAYTYVGERFLLVLDGELEVSTGGRSAQLTAGDALHYSPSPDKLLHIRSDDDVEILWLVTPGVL